MLKDAIWSNAVDAKASALDVIANLTLITLASGQGDDHHAKASGICCRHKRAFSPGTPNLGRGPSDAGRPNTKRPCFNTIGLCNDTLADTFHPILPLLAPSLGAPSGSPCRVSFHGRSM